MLTKPPNGIQHTSFNLPCNFSSVCYLKHSQHNVCVLLSLDTPLTAVVGHKWPQILREKPHGLCNDKVCEFDKPFSHGH